MMAGRSSPAWISGMPVRATMPRASRASARPSSASRTRPPQPTPRRSGAFELDEDQVLGRVEVDGERRLGDLDVSGAGGLGAIAVGGAAARPEGGLDDVGRPEGEGVGPRPVAVGDEDDGRCRPVGRASGRRGVPRSIASIAPR